MAIPPKKVSPILSPSIVIFDINTPGINYGSKAERYAVQNAVANVAAVNATMKNDVSEDGLNVYRGEIVLLSYCSE
jgi:hypothetical protein